ncbi:MAG: GNAT family N-acetyltransferase [Ilumatobacteraceae bacterium]
MEVTRVERAVRARIGRWPYEPDVAHLVLLDHQMVPSGEHLAAWIDEARAAGCRTVRTGALFPTSIGPFLDAGFETIDRLALLETRLHRAAPGRTRAGTAPARRTPDGRRIRMRRLRTRHLDDAAAIDRRAFAPPWGNDRSALADILHATPACRARSVSIGRDMAGFAITGVADRAGYLQRLAVDPTAQRTGLGRSLVADSLAWMRDRGATTAMVNTAFDNTAALTLYESFGFRRREDSLLILELRLVHPT